MLALAAVAAAWTFAVVLAEQPFIIYSPSSAWGIHMQAHGWTLSPSDAYTNISVSSICNCNVACRTDDTRCVAASCSGGSVNGKLTCYLSSSGPADTIVTRASGSHYIYKLDSLPAKHLGVKEDGLLYIIGTEKLTFTDAVSWCEMIPGFRLAIFKTAIQFPMVLNMAQEQDRHLWIDLKNDGTDMVWGDGTLYEDTAIAKVASVSRLGFLPGGSTAFKVHHTPSFRERSRSRRHSPVCQANPHGIEW